MVNEFEAVPKNSPGIMDKIDNIFQNKLFLQYLSGLGGAMSAGQPVGPAINNITQQNIRSQNMMKMLQQLLGPDGSKATFSNAGINLTIPKENAMVADTLKGTASPATPIPSQGGGSVVSNPFTGNFSVPDLAGLTSQDIASALGIKMRQDELKLNREVEKAAAEATANKDTTPNEVKLYQYAVDQGYKGSFIDFKNSSVPILYKEYKEAVKDPRFNKWLLKQKRAGATKISLGEKINERKAMSELEGQLYFNNPKWTEDIDKQVQAFDKGPAWRFSKEDRPLARSKVIVKSIEDKIAAGNGTIKAVIMDKDNRTMIWTVQWPSGDIKTIKQTVR